MRNITPSTDEALIEAARERARAEHTTLNEEFRRWLASYVGRETLTRDYDRLVASLAGKVRIGRRLTREELNER